MTQYYEDFGSPYTTGGALATDTSNAWALQRGGSVIAHTIETFVPGTSGQALTAQYGVTGTVDLTIAVFETPGAQTTSLEAVARCQFGEAMSAGYLNGMYGPQLFTATDLGVGVRRSAANTWRLTRWSLTGAGANIGAALSLADIAADTYFWVRVGRVVGSPDTYRAKVWLDGETEPASWQMTGTDATFAGLAMKAGVGNPAGSSLQLVDPIRWDIFGVGTDGDSAPVTDTSGGNDPPTFDGPLGNLTGTEGTAITSSDVSGEFSDPEDDPLTFSAVGTWPARSGGGSWVSNAGVISGTPASGSAATYSGLKVRASDGTGTVDSNTFTFTVSAAGSTVPRLDSANFPVRHGSPVTLTGANLTGAAVTISYSTVSVAQTEVATATTITIASAATSTLPYGTVTVTATTTEGSATLGVEHRPPIGRDYVVVNVPWNVDSQSIFEGGVAVVDGDQVDFEVESQRGVATLVRDDGTVRVATDVGLHLFDVRLWDTSALEWGALTEISVRPTGYIPGVPTFVGPNIEDANLSEGDSYALAVALRFQDTDLDIVGYATIGEWPPWLVFDTVAGTATGTAAVGSWAGIAVQAIDSEGNTGQSNLFSIVVSAPPRSPTTYVDRMAFRPGVCRAIGEGSAMVYSVTCLALGAVVAPDSARWRLEDDEGTEVVPWTTLVPALSTVVFVPATVQQMRSESNGTEWRTLTVEVDHGTDYAYSDSIRYKLVNQFGI